MDERTGKRFKRLCRECGAVFTGHYKSVVCSECLSKRNCIMCGQQFVACRSTYKTCIDCRKNRVDPSKIIKKCRSCSRMFVGGGTVYYCDDCRHDKPCIICGTLFKPHNISQVACRSSKCRAAVYNRGKLALEFLASMGISVPFGMRNIMRKKVLDHFPEEILALMKASVNRERKHTCVQCGHPIKPNNRKGRLCYKCYRGTEEYKERDRAAIRISYR